MLEKAEIDDGANSDSADFGDVNPSASDVEDKDVASSRVEKYEHGTPHQRSSGIPRPHQPRLTKPPRQRAKVNGLAELPIEPVANASVDAHIFERIRKCLDRANHPNTAEMEAKAALRMSSRLMVQYNVSHADILAQASTSAEQVRLGGESTVAITSTISPSAKVVSQSWVQTVASAMETFFDCKSYSTAWNHKIVWTFYGILQNTIAAAMSFEMAHNLTLEWAREKKGAINSYCLGVGDGLYKIATEEKKTEERLARQREREAMNAKIEQERIDRQRELDRLYRCDDGVKTGPALLATVGDEIATSTQLESIGALSDEDSSSEHAFSPDALELRTLDADELDEIESKPTFKLENEMPLDPSADFEEELQKIIKQEGSPTPFISHLQEESDPTYDGSEGDLTSKIKNADTTGAELDIKNESADNQPIDGFSLWKSSQQVILFRESAMNIAEQYLRAQAIKLKNGRKRSYSVRDRGAYLTGKDDSRKIDVRRRRLE